MSRPDAGSLISRSAARNASVDGVAIFLLNLSRSIEGHHLMCLDQIWRMTSGTPMVRRPAGVPTHKMPWNNNGPGPWGNPGGNQGRWIVRRIGWRRQGGGDDGQTAARPLGRRARRWLAAGAAAALAAAVHSGPNGPFPDIDSLIRQAQAFIRNLLPGGRGMGFGGADDPGRGRAWRCGVASGFYRVQPDEQGIVLRFGAYKYWTPPGLHWHIPWPVEEVERPAVTRINRTEIGFRSGASGQVEAGTDNAGRDVLAESLMLTGDENIIDIDFVVFWRIRPNDASKFLFNARRPPIWCSASRKARCARSLAARRSSRRWPSCARRSKAT